MKRLLFALLFFHLFAHAARPPPTPASFTPEQIAASQKIKHLIIVYQENWSFDSLYGKFPGVNGIAQARPENTQQVDHKGLPYASLPPSIDIRTGEPYPEISTRLPNAPFNLLPFLSWNRTTGDLVHRFYQEQAQINGGMMNGFVRDGDSGGFAMSYYDVSNTRLGKLAQQFTICDNFFHSCYGGSMNSVLWLFSAQMPVWPNAPKEIIAKVAKDGLLIKDGLVSPEGYLINDAEPFYPPYKADTPECLRVPPQTYSTIGDRLSEKGISWGWFAQGWTAALSDHPPPKFIYHHQAPSYFKQFAPDTKARQEHLFDLDQFCLLLDKGNVPAVSFIRSTDTYSQHPGENAFNPGQEWCADFVERVQKSPIWKDCAIIIVYDENGGRWDHVTPPVVDRFGPGTRVPAIIISPYAKKAYVDHTCYETVSILKFIEERWSLAPLSSRDKQANNLLNAFDFKP